MPIVHAPAGTPAGGQFAPGGGANQPPKLTGTPQQQRAESKYLKALARKKKSDARNVSKYLHALSSAQKKKLAAQKKALATKKAAARKQAVIAKAAAKLAAKRAAPITGKVAKQGTYKPFVPGKK